MLCIHFKIWCLYQSRSFCFNAIRNRLQTLVRGDLIQNEKPLKFWRSEKGVLKIFSLFNTKKLSLYDFLWGCRLFSMGKRGVLKIFAVQWGCPEFFFALKSIQPGPLTSVCKQSLKPSFVHHYPSIRVSGTGQFKMIFGPR